MEKQTAQAEKVCCIKNQYNIHDIWGNMLLCDNCMLNINVIFKNLSVFLIEHVHCKMVTFVRHVTSCHMSLHVSKLRSKYCNTK